MPRPVIHDKIGGNSSAAALQHHAVHARARAGHRMPRQARRARAAHLLAEFALSSARDAVTTSLTKPKRQKPVCLWHTGIMSILGWRVVRVLRSSLCLYRDTTDECPRGRNGCLGLSFSSSVSLEAHAIRRSPACLRGYLSIPGYH
jgi:hypothetical protein